MLLISGYLSNPPAILEGDHRFPLLSRLIAFGVTSVLFALLCAQTVMAQSAQDHARVGISFAKHGKLTEAENELQQAVQAAPAVAVYRAQLGSVLGLEE